MSLALAMKDDGETMRERKCIVTGEVREEAQLIRFAVSPDGQVTPDVAAKLPGRGMWVSADRAILERAIAKNHFSNSRAVRPLPSLQGGCQPAFDARRTRSRAWRARCGRCQSRP